MEAVPDKTYSSSSRWSRWGGSKTQIGEIERDLDPIIAIDFDDDNDDGDDDDDDDNDDELDLSIVTDWTGLGLCLGHAQYFLEHLAIMNK